MKRGESGEEPKEHEAPFVRGGSRPGMAQGAQKTWERTLGRDQERAVHKKSRGKNLSPRVPRG